MSQNPEPSNLLASAPAEANVNATAPDPLAHTAPAQAQAPAAAAASETDATDRPVSSPRSPNRATLPSSPHSDPLDVDAKQALDPLLSHSLNLFESHSSMATPQSPSALDSPPTDPARIMDSDSPGKVIKDEVSLLNTNINPVPLGSPQHTTEPTATTIINGHTPSESPAEQAPVKRGPGRPPRSQMVASPSPVVDTSSESTSRPRRTPRAVTISPVSGSPVTVDTHTTRSQDGTPAPTTPESTNASRMSGQRTSSRQIRTPGKFLTDFSPTPMPSKISTAKATPSNQRPLLNQQATPEPPRKRGPGRPVTNPNNANHRSAAVAKSAPPSPPPVIPMKRGPGRPPRNPLSLKATPHVDNTTGSRTKSKSASPTMIRSSNHATTNGSRSSTATSTPKSPSLAASEPIRRGPGRPPRSSDSGNPPTSSSSPTSSYWKHPTQTQVVVPGSSSSSSRSRKRYNKSEAEEEEMPGSPDGFESGFPLRKRRVVSLTNMAIPSQNPMTRSKPLPPPEPPKPPRPLTALDRLRLTKVAEWEGKLHEVIDHHDSLARELYHLETYTTMLTYDPVKLKSDHSEKMIRFLRNFDLWSQVPDLVSSVQLSTNRISTRRSANEHREQLVDMLQKNVEGALPRRMDLSGTIDLIRQGPLRGYPSQFSSFDQYLNSFVYMDDDEVTPEEADNRAEAHAQLLDRIDALKSEGRLGGKPDKPFVDPEVPKLQYNWLMEHVMTSSRLIKEEGKLQMARARKVSKMITRHFEQLHGKSEREQRLEEKRIRKVAKLTSNEVKKKWRYVEGIVKARHKALLKEEQEEAGKRHLNLILEHSTQILEVQQSTLIGAPVTPAVSDALDFSEGLSDIPSVLSATEPSSRRSSVAPSVVSSDAELDAGDAEFTAAEPDADDETTLANEESGSEDDEEEINGLAAEMDIPIEELLRQYGYQLSGGEESDGDDEQDEEETDDIAGPSSTNKKENSSEPSPKDQQQDVQAVLQVEEDTKQAASTLKDVIADDSMTMQVDVETEGGRTQASKDTHDKERLASIASSPTLSEERVLTSKEIANALPDGIKAASKPSPSSSSERGHYAKRRRLSLTDLYRGPPLPWNPYGEVDDERTMEQEELEQENSDPQELTDLMLEKDMPIEDLLDRYAYEAESSEYSDSYYDSDSEYEGMGIMSSQQRAKPADTRFVVTLQDVATSRKFPTRPSSEFTDTDTEYDDNRTISIYGTDDELSLGDMLPLLDPEVRPKTPEIDISETGANVKTKIPFLLKHQLREYQHVGMDWLASLYSNGLNGILADEMGLGKTMQTIALLAHLACEHGVWGPHLIVVPTSVMLNWEMEFKKWCPGFKIMTYYGSPRERKEKRVGWSREHAFHVCITSYQLVVQDQTVFRRKAWQYLILDEAHNIKNFRSQRWQTLLNFNSARRLLLTGTPLQNNLMELWSLLYFLMPNGVSETMPVGFANQKEFQEWFSHPVDRMIEGNEQQDEDSKAAIARLHTVLRPYLLRRLKADVETQMPAKYEHIVYCRLSKRQRFLYDDFMSRAKTRETLASGNFLSIINCLMQLRKVCNHPDLFEVRPIVTSFAMPSAVTSFGVNEFLVRRKMFSEIDKARESVNLEFLGLVFTNAEDRLSRMDLGIMEELDASRCFQRKASEFASTQAKTLSNGHHYQDIRQYSSMRRHLHLQTSRQRWEQLGYVNSNRCLTNLMFGSSLLRMCQEPPRVKKGCAHILDQASDPRQYLKYTNAIAQAVVSSADRFHQSQETIKRFAFVTPAVLVRDQTWSPTHINPNPSSLELAYQQAEEFLHPVESCLQVQFPDKRLLQFDCGKLQKLDSLLRELKSGGHRALIFTQMTKVLDILEIFLNIHGHRYLRLDGATKVENRQHLTDRFNSDPKILAFILSTRSGGVGINLTGADTVIFYDSDWNPSMDRQCQDRCHRIGQTRDVHIYRFVSEFTIEENMLKKANQKRMLDNVVIQEGEFTTDYFQKMDWRDMLGEEDLAKIGDLGPISADGEPQDLSTVHGADLEQALAAAEDENDVLAMQQAKHEMEGVDVGDFSEAAAGAAGKQGETRGARVQFETSSSNAVNDEEEGDVIEMGHVDEYMLRFMEREYGHYVGFGGLPKPIKLDDVDNEDDEQMEEEEEEEEEEEDEYDIEDDEDSDSGQEGGEEDSSASEAEEEEVDNAVAQGKRRKEEDAEDAAVGVEAMDEDE
ncbi:swr1 complex component [Mortierella sp. NVP41]|nr:swr1 complex component [Mortierella sp. NVP41]